MSWQAYKVVFRLRAPMHIGMGKIGNLQRTRPYVTGRVLWGALTMRLTRDAAEGNGAATDTAQYQKVGEQVHKTLAFTYFYPALRLNGDYQVQWSWEQDTLFRRRFLSSYQGTALYYPNQSAAEGMLHEIEFLSPYTLDSKETVYLLGYIFEKEGCGLKWQSSLRRLQLGGERGYGWGNVELIEDSKFNQQELFGSKAIFIGTREEPQICLPQNEKRLLAHAWTANLIAGGEIEPLVGREWRSNDSKHKHAGQYLDFDAVCYSPGSVVLQDCVFKVSRHGVWQAIESAAS